MVGASQARGFYVTAYLTALERVGKDRDEEARALALEVTTEKFTREAAEKAQKEFHKE